MVLIITKTPLAIWHHFLQLTSINNKNKNNIGGVVKCIISEEERSIEYTLKMCQEKMRKPCRRNTLNH